MNFVYTRHAFLTRSILPSNCLTFSFRVRKWEAPNLQYAFNRAAICVNTSINNLGVRPFKLHLYFYLVANLSVVRLKRGLYF